MDHNEQGLPALLSACEVAKKLRVSANLVRVLMKSGEIPSVALGGRNYVNTEALAIKIRAGTTGAMNG